MRRLSLAIALVACAAPRPMLPPSPALATPATTASVSASSSVVGETSGEIAVAFLGPDGATYGDDGGEGRALAECASHVGTARGWVLLELHVAESGMTNEARVVERVGLPPSVANCAAQRLRGKYLLGKHVYLSVQ